MKAEELGCQEIRLARQQVQFTSAVSYKCSFESDESPISFRLGSGTFSGLAWSFARELIRRFDERDSR